LPIKIPDSLPARSVLEREHIFVMTKHRALHQDIRPLRIALVNLMPTKIATETQILRCLANTPLQIEVDLVQMASHKSLNTPEDHLLHFYETFEDIKDRVYDGCIITGAPVELLDYEDVDYWPELCRIFEWTKTNVQSTFHICWAAQAGLYYHYGIPKYILPQKVFGVFPHYALTKKSRLFRGFDDVYWVPHSRQTEVRAEDIEKVPQLRIMSVSPEVGIHIVSDQEGRQYFVMGHSEYDVQTLGTEYCRDLEKGTPIAMPKHYYPGNDPSREPVDNWRATGQLLYTNWLNYFVYQTTPFDLHTLGDDSLDCAML
jgi:homoserine O-succinyltransferase